MNGIVIAFSGGIKGGKSSVSREVAMRLGLPRVSFGDQVRAVVQSRGLDPTDRDILQVVGQELIDTNTAGFCRAVLSQSGTAWAPGKDLIVDGLRHFEAATALRDLVMPSALRIVFIDAEFRLRAARVADQTAAGKLARWDQHPTETQVANTIPRIADLIVDGSRPIDVAINEIIAWAQAGAIARQ